MAREVEREHTRELAGSGSNLNQIERQRGPERDYRPSR